MGRAPSWREENTENGGLFLTDNYNRTIRACFVGYIVQAIVNNFVPLLFITFQKNYGIPMHRITLLITINFGIQLFVDLLSAKLIDKIGYRTSAVIAHAFSAVGLVLLTVLPDACGDAYVGILLSVALYAIGGGLLEVLVSPIVEACPTDNKGKAMSLLHSFYCWGHVGVVLLSTLFFAVFGTKRWMILALLWAVLPVVNGILFTRVPLAAPEGAGETGMSFRQLMGKKVFWMLMLMMLCAGASEQAVSQWASAFAEKGLGVTKTVGDLAGPMAFAALMGLSRLFYGKYGDRIDLNRFMTGSCLVCVLSYLCIALVPGAFFGLIGCAVCGLAVGIMWPGTFSEAAACLRGGGTAMYAFLALAGDLGCSAGPTLVGTVSSMAKGDLRIGISAAVVFPVLLVLGVLYMKKRGGAR